MYVYTVLLLCTASDGNTKTKYILIRTVTPDELLTYAYHIWFGAVSAVWAGTLKPALCAKAKCFSLALPGTRRLPVCISAFSAFDRLSNTGFLECKLWNTRLASQALATLTQSQHFLDLRMYAQADMKAFQ